MRRSMGFSLTTDASADELSSVSHLIRRPAIRSSYHVGQNDYRCKSLINSKNRFVSLKMSRNNSYGIYFSNTLGPQMRGGRGKRCEDEKRERESKRETHVRRNR